MIVRLMGEGQWRVADRVAEELNAIDSLLDADVRGGDAGEFEAHLAAMHELVKTKGAAVPEHELVPSEALVPPIGITIEELRELLGDEGLIPN